MESSESTGECTAHNKYTNQECNCTDYVDALDIPGYCSNCYHKRQDHLASKPGAAQKSTSVRALLAGILRGRESDTKGKASSTSKGPPRASATSFAAAVASSSNKPKSLAFSAANRESNCGMRSGSGNSQSKVSKKGKGKAVKREMFKVMSVHIIPSGTVVVNNVRQLPKGSDKIPDRAQAQAAQLQGLAVVKNNDGISFERDASHEEVVIILSDLLPRPFEYFREREEETGEPAWDLATPIKQKLVIVPSDDSERPDGLTIDFNKGPGTSGFQNSRIFIGILPRPNPAEFLRDWASPNSFLLKEDQDESDVDDYKLGSESDNHEIAPLKNKRRLSSRHSDEEDDFDVDERPSKRTKNESSGKRWTRAPEIMNDREIGEECIDVTVDDAQTARSTPDFLRKPP
ncbi:hypothetical protein C8R45DRAFT_1102414 [Mycena sanguinolenta]|nr:hypothetical protein C8R45DRAFT_1102414 [Mycena sanguinolenta]